MDGYKGHGGYHSRDERREPRDRTYQSKNPFNGSAGSSSSHGNGGYTERGDQRDRNGGPHGRHGNGNSERDRYGNSGDRYENRGDRYGNSGDRNYGRGNGGERNEGYRHGNGGYRGGDYGASGRSGGDRERSASSSHSNEKQGSYDKNSGSRSGSDHGHDTKYEQPMDSGRQSDKRSAPDDSQAGSSKRSTSGRQSSLTRKSDGPREKRDRYEILRTLPEGYTSKKGSSGQSIKLRANFFELNKRPNWEMVMYRIDFDPECPLVPDKKYLMYTQKDLLGSYLYDTQNSVYLTHRLAHDITRVESVDRQGTKYTMTIKFGTTVPMDTRESLQVLNLILRRSMEGLKLELIGRNLFDPAGRIDLRSFGLQLWPGYITSIRQHERDVLLCTEIATKVMRLETVYNMLMQCGRGQDFKTKFTESVLGLVVLTDYNNKTYRITDVDWDKSPSDTFITRKGGKESETSFIDYYFNKYRVKIQNPTQPMLISRSTEKQRRGGEDETISLIPELCRPTGLTDQQRNNWQLMKGVADHTRLDARNRMDRLRRFNRRLNSTPESTKILQDWNLELNKDLVSLDGRVLLHEKIFYGDNVKEPTLENADWQLAFKDHTMYMAFPLRNWCIIVPRTMKGAITRFMGDMERASRQMKFELQRATIIEINDRNDEYPMGFQNAARHNPQLVMVFVSNNNADRYASIKKIGCCNFGIPTQVVVSKTLNNRNLLSIATKVAIQLNCKLGGLPWLVDIPTRGLMAIGIDVSRDSKTKSISWGSIVATMDLKNVKGESFFSAVSCHKDSSEFSTQLAIDVTKAIRAYEETNQALPEKICVYRDGVGEGQTKFVFETELVQIKERLDQIYKQKYGEDAKLKFAFIVVSKKINTRIFGSNERNPPPGTVVDDTITLPERYDFYLVSQTVRQGTVAPTSYNVLYDTMGFNADKIQLLTYKQCHLYYNWAGTVRVPAVCQYAHKLTFLAAQCLHQVPKNELEKKLYFL